jgi:hypothetical protein
MNKCVFCKEDIKPRLPAISIVGGLFDPDDPAFFVVDEDVMSECYSHRECLVKALAKDDQDNV